MKTKGIFKGLSRDLDGGLIVSFRAFEEKKVIGRLEDIKTGTLEITVEPVKKKRSLSANALLWNCIGEISAKLRTDKWSVYLMMLRRYGKFTYICVKPNAVEAVKKQWREAEEIGTVTIGGEKAVQMLCYFGSSTYDSKEFAVLLDGVISEMEEMGLNAPLRSDMRRALERWEKSGNL